MDSFDEKKWFIYVGDHHEGPHSLGDLEQKFKDGSANAGSYVWAEGMPDWKQILEIPTFEPLLRKFMGTTAPPPVAPTSSIHLEMSTGMLAPPVGGQPTLPDFASQLPPPEQIAAEAARTRSNPLPPLETVPELSVPSDTGEKTAKTPAPEKPKKSSKSSKTSKTKATSVSKLLQHGVDSIQNALQLATGDSSKKKSEKALELEQPPKQIWAESPQVERKSSSRRERDNDRDRRKGDRRRKPLLGGLLFPIVLLAIGAWAYSNFSPALFTQWKNYATQGGASTLILRRLTDAIPVLGALFAPFPKPEAVSDDDYEQMKSAARGKAMNDGTKVAIGVAAAALGTPIIYISSNVGDGTLFKVSIEGVSDTLLNQLEFSRALDVTVTGHLGHAPPLTLDETKPIPRGQYVVTVIGAGLPQAVTKTYFLGGEKDAQYTQRLREYHERLRTKAQGELMELRQFEVTLESRFNQTRTRFDDARRARKEPEQIRRWEDFEASWGKMERQLRDTFKKWRVDISARDFFYGALYEQTYQLGEALDSYHQLQQNYFKGRPSDNGYEIQLGEAMANVDNALSVLKARLDQAEKMPPSPNGMPKRESL